MSRITALLLAASAALSGTALAGDHFHALGFGGRSVYYHAPIVAPAPVYYPAPVVVHQPAYVVPPAVSYHSYGYPHLGHAPYYSAPVIMTPPIGVVSYSHGFAPTIPSMARYYTPRYSHWHGRNREVEIEIEWDRRGGYEVEVDYD